MNKTTRILLFVIPLILLGFAIWQLSNIVAFILVAFVISMVGEPMVSLLGKLRIRSWYFPRWLCSLITLILIWILLFVFFRFFIPLLAQELQYFATLDMQSVFNSLDEPISKIEAIISDYKLSVDEGFTIKGWAAETISEQVGVEKITTVIKGIAGAVGNIFVAFVVISFTSFFFMKEAYLFENSLVLFFPEDQEKKISHALSSITRFLKRYFIGVTLQITGIIIINSIGLSIVGLDFNTGVTIALISGILNVIPYIGPLIGIMVGLFIGTAVSVPMDFYSELLPRLFYIFLAMEFTQVIDNVVFQPLIFSKSVMAHPLEIFLVIISAGTLGGVVGMILAVPIYTVLRVVAKEFMNHSKLVQKLTERL
ncbi:MAG: AI-2E family transporter [Bacteroidales bacterium]|nr:AI-2E family transporter [Bacteroidales bacterium]